jgi:DNA-binding transcriptional ArsR family regulator
MPDVFKALSHPGRRRILIALRQGPMTPTELSDALDVKMPNLSAQLSVLREAGMVFAHRNGVSLIYELNTSVIETALGALMSQLRVGEDVDADTDGNGDHNNATDSTSPPTQTSSESAGGQPTERNQG